jgi:hypothetical protein
MKRRDFLKTAASVAAPLVVSQHALSAPGEPGANDPKKNEFLGDEQANRLRAEAAREPWCMY